MLSGRENIKTRELKIIFFFYFETRLQLGYVYREKFQRASEIKGGKKHQFFNYLKVHGKKRNEIFDMKEWCN